MYFVTREFTWAMAHRLGDGYDGKCRNLHGHTYKCQVTFGCESLDQDWMVIDFGAIKKICGEYIDEMFDHGVFASTGDKALLKYLSETGQQCFAIEGNTTVEKLAESLLNAFRHRLEKHLKSSVMFVSKGLMITTLTVFETDNCWCKVS